VDDANCCSRSKSFRTTCKRFGHCQIFTKPYTPLAVHINKRDATFCATFSPHRVPPSDSALTALFRRVGCKSFLACVNNFLAYVNKVVALKFASKLAI
jgi:hypothetical protein